MIQSRWMIFVSLTILSLLIWTRLYSIEKTLEFFSDIGRDHYVLIQAVKGRKPPLLGPSTSALPINQSPIYFYLNFPIFILSGYSPYTTVYTLLLLLLASFVFALYSFRNNTRLFLVLVSVVLLVLFHPLILEQSRYPWNPTYTLPFLICALVFLIKQFSTTRSVFLFSLSLAIAVGCSYSVLPTVAVLFLFAFIKFPERRKQLIVSAIGGFGLVFLPLFIVDIKTNFLLTKNILSSFQDERTAVTFYSRFSEILSYITGMEVGSWTGIIPLLGIPIVSVVYSLSSKNINTRGKLHAQFGVLFLLALVCSVLPPFHMQEHYIFGVTILFFFTVATMKLIPQLLFLSALVIIWLPDIGNVMQFQPRRTIADLQACAQHVCATEKKPIYVSEQAWHSYHFAPDHLFFMNKSGCEARDISQHPGFADRMAVVIDQSSYEHGKTAFHELTLFGTSKIDTTYSCPGNIQVILLRKDE